MHHLFIIFLSPSTVVIPFFTKSLRNFLRISLRGFRRKSSSFLASSSPFLSKSVSTTTSSSSSIPLTHSASPLGLSMITCLKPILSRTFLSFFPSTITVKPFISSRYSRSYFSSSFIFITMMVKSRVFPPCNIAIHPWHVPCRATDRGRDKRLMWKNILNLFLQRFKIYFYLFLVFQPKDLYTFITPPVTWRSCKDKNMRRKSY